MLTYAVGDVHGCLGLLLALLERIRADAVGRPHRLVFLGDYIDRGPDSAGVIRVLQQLGADRGEGEVVCLKGNHEDLCLRAVAEPDYLPNWIHNGGGAMLASFGVDSLEEVPPDVIAWMAACPTSFEDERRCFVHAGLRPGYLSSQQTDRDRLWIREKFLSGDHDFGRFVVHGHTPQRDGHPDLRRFRVNLDTAAVYGGSLTAARFGDEGDAPEAFLQTKW